MKTILLNLLIIFATMFLASCDNPQNTDLIDSPNCKPNSTFFTIPTEIVSISNDRTNGIFYRGLSGIDFYFIDFKTKSVISLSNYFYDQKRNAFALLMKSNVYSSRILSCPYDSEKYFAPLSSINNIEQNELFWAIIEPEIKKMEEIQLSVYGEDFAVINKSKVRIIGWLNTSSEGNDYFFLSNNTILHRQTGNILPGVPNLDLDEDTQITSVSHDGKFVIYEKKSNIYINNSLFSNGKSVVDWSDDSKSIVLTSMVDNGTGVKRYEIAENGVATLKNTINLYKKYCSGGPSIYCSFLSKNSIGACVYKYDQVSGNLFELNFDGSLVRELTNYTD